MKFIKYRLIMLYNSMQSASFGDVFKSVFFSSLSFLFMLGLYFGFFRLISYLDKLPYIGSIIIYKILALIFLTAFVMIIFSSLITSLNTLFFSGELNLLFSLPISARKIFLSKAFESFIYSSWMMLVVLLPFLAAFARLKGLGQGFFACFMIMGVPYLIIPAFIGVLITMTLFYFFPSSKLRDAVIVIVVVLGASLYMLFRIIQPEKLVNADVLNQVIQYIVLLEAPTAVYLPSWWISEAIRTYVLKQWGDFGFYGALLFAAGAVVVYLSVILAEKLYYKSWNQALTSTGSRRRKNRGFASKRFFKGLRGKEFALFFRSPEQWPQLILLAALIAVYLFSIYRLPADTIYIRTILSFLNIGFAGFVLSAIVLRFVFPSISLEGKSFWLIKSLPVSIKEFVLSKWFFYSLPVLLIGLALVGLSCYLLDEKGFVMYFSIASMFFMAFGILSLGIGFGAAFPKFLVSNIAKIESSSGGVYFMIASLFYVGATISMEAVLMQIYFYQKLKTDFHAYMPVAAGVAAVLIVWHTAAIFLPLYLGRKSLENYEMDFTG